MFHRLLTASLLLASLSSTALADTDSKVYPATMCRSSSSSFVMDSYGRMYNSSTTSAVTAYCPIIDDEVDSSTGSNALDVVFHVIDRSSASSISCTLVSRSINSTSTSDTDSATSPGFSSSVVTLSLGSTATGLSWGEEFEYISCSIPARDSTYGSSYLIAYDVSEDATL